MVFPNTHYATSGRAPRGRPSAASRPSCQQQLAHFEAEGKLLEAQRLRMRTEYDLEMLQEMGFCNGIENYSAPIDGRGAGRGAQHPARLLPGRTTSRSSTSPTSTIPQLHGQYEGDRSRKETLIEHGFRLPSAADNRPLRFEEWVERVGQTVFLSATPGDVGARALQPTWWNRSCAPPG